MQAKGGSATLGDQSIYGNLFVAKDIVGTMYARAGVSTYAGHLTTGYMDAAIRSHPATEDDWIYCDTSNAQYGIYHRQIASTLVVAGEIDLPADSIAFIGNNHLQAYISLGDGSAVFKSLGINVAPSSIDQVVINSIHGSTGNSAFRLYYNGGTSVLGEVAFIAHRNGVWAQVYASGAGSSLAYAFYADGTKPSVFLGAVGIGTSTLTGALSILTGTAATFNPTTMPDGSISFTNGSGVADPNMTGKSSGYGLTVAAVTANAATNYDMQFNIRMNTNADYTTKTGLGFVWSRYATTLMTLDRSGKLGVGIVAGTYTVEVGGLGLGLINSSSGITLFIGGKVGTSYNYTFDTASGPYLKLLSAQAGATPVCFASNGDLWVGFTTSQGSYKLQVNGVGYFSAGLVTGDGRVLGGFDLIVASAADIATWQAGVYRRVYVKKGTYTVSALTASGCIIDNTISQTELIVAEPGSCFQYTGTVAGTIYGIYDLNSVIQSITGLTIILNNTDTTNNGVVCYYNVYHMKNCFAQVVNNNSSTGRGFEQCSDLVCCGVVLLASGSRTINGFDNCSLLSNCSVDQSLDSRTLDTYFVTGFFGCYNMSNCRYISGPYYKSMGFSTCFFLSSCVADLTSSMGGYGYSQCRYISSCSALLPTGTATDVYGYSSCYSLSSCKVSINTSVSSAGSVYGYYSCLNVVACNADLIGNTSGNLYGFYLCHVVTGCLVDHATNAGSGGGISYSTCRSMVCNRSPAAPFKSAQYSACYASEDTSVVAAPTAAGGFNAII